MSERITLVSKPEAAGSVEFVTSGSCLLDLVLGGGWAQGRVVNIVGDASTGKTLLAIEACANFRKMVKSASDIRYMEAEAAFDDDYAQTLGFPSDVESCHNVKTVEDFFTDISKFVATRKTNELSLYILDSLDALSSNAELERDIDDKSYGMEKARKLSETFRRVTADVEDANCTLAIISQIRDKINAVPFGETKTRAGGKALQFYCSQIVWLAETGKIHRTVKGIKRVVGIDVQAKCKKNKCGLPFREAQFPIIFGYGIDDEQSMLDWLKTYNVLETKELQKELDSLRENRDRTGLRQLNVSLRNSVTERWIEVEETCKPKMSKY